MNLRIEDTILLKPYAMPWREDGYDHLPGWTPDDLDPWVVARTEEIMDEWKKAGKMPSLMFAKKQATDEFVQWRKEKRLPVPGWAPETWPGDLGGGLGGGPRRKRRPVRL